MVKVQDFSGPPVGGGFEKNIQHAGERVRVYKENPSFREAPEREVVKKSFQPQVVPPPSPGVPPAAGDGSGNEQGLSEDAEFFLPDYFLGGDADGMKEAVLRLAETALHGDLEKSLKDARKLSPYLEDAFHDALVDKLVPEMRKRGLL
ncbi:MAG: hypothetical protein AAB967_02555 [Patescibacteria group bacterium]